MFPVAQPSLSAQRRRITRGASRFLERRRVHAVLARFVATLGYSHRPGPGSPPRNNRPELGVDLRGGVEHRSDVRVQYDRDN